MTEKVTYKLVLQGNNGKTYYAHVDWLRTELKIHDLEARIHDLEKPLRKQQILDILQTQGLRSAEWLRRHIPHFEWGDFRELLDEGKVFSEQHGNRTMYGVVNEP